MAYVEGDYARDLADRKRTSGTVFIIGISALFWKWAKQDFGTLSSTEAGHTPMCTALRSVLGFECYMET